MSTLFINIYFLTIFDMRVTTLFLNKPHPKQIYNIDSI